MLVHTQFGAECGAYVRYLTSIFVAMEVVMWWSVEANIRFRQQCTLKLGDVTTCQANCLSVTHNLIKIWIVIDPHPCIRAKQNSTNRYVKKCGFYVYQSKCHSITPNGNTAIHLLHEQTKINNIWSPPTAYQFLIRSRLSLLNRNKM